MVAGDAARPMILGWHAVIADGDVRHSYSIELDCTPEYAIGQAMARARVKYGEDQEWAKWKMRAEPIPPTAGLPVRLEWRHGQLRRL